MGARKAPKAVEAAAASKNASKTVSAPGHGRGISPRLSRISKSGSKSISGSSANGRTVVPAPMKGR